MSTPIKLEVHVVSESGRRAGIGDICVTIANAPVSVVLMLPDKDAEALALQVMAAVDEARGHPLFREQRCQAFTTQRIGAVGYGVSCDRPKGHLGPHGHGVIPDWEELPPYEWNDESAPQGPPWTAARPHLGERVEMLSGRQDGTWFPAIVQSVWPVSAGGYAIKGKAAPEVIDSVGDDLLERGPAGWHRPAPPWERHGVVLPREEPTRPQCSVCLKDCAACHCADDLDRLIPKRGA